MTCIHMARIVGLSVPAVSNRMRKLEDHGVITGYTALVSPRALRFDVTAFVFVTVTHTDGSAELVRRASALSEVQEIHAVTGGRTHLLKIRTRNTLSLERLLEQMQSWPGVHATSTSIVLNTHKETRRLPVDPMDLPIPA